MLDDASKQPLRRLQNFFKSKAEASSPDNKNKMVNPMAILLPLYIYPATGAWDILYTNITANPHLTFAIVINPNSGPGAPPYPDPDYIAGIAQLNSYPNTELYGYVHTLTATRSQSLIKADIRTYAHWQDYSRADIHMDGIFFDEAPSAYSKTTYSTMTAITNYARSTIYADNVKVIFNPGVIPDSRYYDIADTIVAFEDYYANYNSKTLSTIPQVNRAKSAILMHHFTGTLQDQTAIVSSLTNGGLQALWISDQPDYDSWSSKWGLFCSEMASPT